MPPKRQSKLKVIHYDDPVTFTKQAPNTRVGGHFNQGPRETTKKVVKGPGKDLVNQKAARQKKIDPVTPLKKGQKHTRKMTWLLNHIKKSYSSNPIPLTYKIPTILLGATIITLFLASTLIFLIIDKMLDSFEEDLTLRGTGARFHEMSNFNQSLLKLMDEFTKIQIFKDYTTEHLDFPVSEYFANLSEDKLEVEKFTDQYLTAIENFVKTTKLVDGIQKKNLVESLVLDSININKAFRTLVESRETPIAASPSKTKSTTSIKSSSSDLAIKSGENKSKTKITATPIAPRSSSSEPKLTLSNSLPKITTGPIAPKSSSSEPKLALSKSKSPPKITPKTDLRTVKSLDSFKSTAPATSTSQLTTGKRPEKSKSTTSISSERGILTFKSDERKSKSKITDTPILPIVPKSSSSETKLTLTKTKSSSPPKMMVPKAKEQPILISGPSKAKSQERVGPMGGFKSSVSVASTLSNKPSDFSEEDKAKLNQTKEEEKRKKEEEAKDEEGLLGMIIKFLMNCNVV